MLLAISLAMLRYLMLALFAVVLFTIARQNTKHSATLSFVLLFLLLPFLVQTSWPHYFVFLPFCQIVLLKITLTENIKRKVAILLLNLASIILVSAPFFLLHPGSAAYMSLGFCLYSDMLLLLGFLIYFIQTFKPPSPLAWLFTMPLASLPSYFYQGLKRILNPLRQ